jgi:hypothetical protein
MSKIQFVAHHELQAQVFIGIIPYLHMHECSISIGQDVIIQADVDVVVLADHLVFQKNIVPSSNYLLVHLSHDVADLEVYREESIHLKYFSLILCPTIEHLEISRKLFPAIPSFFVGWQKNMAKYNKIDLGSDRDKTVIFAPTEIADLDWKPIIQGLMGAQYRVIIKNHVYWDFENQAPAPRGQEERYLQHRIQLEKMESYVEEIGSEYLKIVDRRSNITELFESASILITDNSSAAIEFQSHGLSIELGLLDSNSGVRNADVSKVSKEVMFVSEVDLLDWFKNGKCLLEFEKLRVRQENESKIKNSLMPSLPSEPDRISAYLIDNLAPKKKERWKRIYLTYFLSLKFHYLKARL